MPILTASLTNIMVWNAEPHVKFQICLPQEGLIYFQILQLFSDLVGLPPNGNSTGCHYFQRPVNYCHHYASIDFLNSASVAFPVNVAEATLAKQADL
jgi:hypothetical protein